MNLDLSNIVIKAYKKKNKKIALHLKGHLLVFTNTTFSFTGYLKEMQGWVTLPGQSEIETKSMSISVDCVYSENIMVHHLSVEFELPYQKLNTSIANLKLMFHISFTGHPYEEPTYIEKKAVIVTVPSSWL